MINNGHKSSNPMPGRPALLSRPIVQGMAREGRAPLAIVAGLNAQRHDERFAARFAAMKIK
jgi:hypothetical protein